MGWLVDIEEAIDWAFTPDAILETEEQYPGLWDDIFIELWQRRLIKDQVEQESGEEQPDG